MTKINREEFNSYIEDIKNNTKFNKLTKELHHGISRYDHCMRVAKWSYKVCNFFNMKNKEDVTRAALLHDFYVDEDLTSTTGAGKLGEHPNVALVNSLEYFDLNAVQQDIIKSHMFPCTMVVPKYKESWLVSTVDKVVGTYEMLRFKSPLYMGIYLIFIFELIRLPR